MFLSKISCSLLCLALSLSPCSAWAQSIPAPTPAAPTPAAPATIMSAPKGADATGDAIQEWHKSTLQLVRKLEGVSRTSTTYEAYKNQLAQTTKELEIALKDAPDDVVTFSVRNAMSFYGRASELQQFVAESHNSAYVYRQKADGFLQIYVGKYKKVRRGDKLSDRRAELVDAPLSKIWKNASYWLTKAQDWTDTSNKNN